MLVNVVPTALIRRFQESAPVDVVGLAHALGLQVWEARNLPAGISGKLFKDRAHGGAEGYSIVVNASDAFVRKRFTIAHELAHFILHRQQVGSELSDDVWYRSGLSNEEEAEANRLAADILMPLHLIRDYAAKGFTSVEGLAEVFGVSRDAMRIKLGMK
jgi:hypothetical protein